MVAAPRLYIADPRDWTKQVVDLNGLEHGDSTGFALVDDPDFGEQPAEHIWLSQPPWPGAILAGTYRPNREMTFRLYAEECRYADLVALRERLILGLDRPAPDYGLLVWQPADAAEPDLIDYYPAPFPQLLRGQERGLFKILTLLQDPDGLPIKLTVPPFVRLPEREAGGNLLVNPTLMEGAMEGVTPIGWAWTNAGGVSGHHAIPDEGWYGFTLSDDDQHELRQTVSPASPGQQHVASGEAICLDSEVVFRLEVEYLDGGGAILAEFVSASVVLTSTRTRYQIAGTAPAGTASVRYVARLAQGFAANVRYGRFQLELGGGGGAGPFRSSPAVVTNSLTASQGKRIWLWNEGKVPALTRVEVAGDGGSLAGITMHRLSGSSLVMALPSVLVRQADALYNGTTVVADTSATGSQTAETDPTEVGVLRKRWSRTFGQVGKGVYDVKMAVRVQPGNRFRAQARYYFEDPSNVYTLEPVPLDSALITAGDYSTVDFGQIRVPRDVSSLTLQGWLAQDAGTGVFRWDAAWLARGDQVIRAQFPQPEEDAFQREVWRGSELLTPAKPTGLLAGTLVGQALILNATSEAAGTPPNTGLDALETARYVFGATLILVDPSRTKQKVGELRVYDVLPGTAVLIEKLDLWTSGAYHERVRRQVRFDADPTKAYQADVVFTAAAGPEIHVTKVGLQAVPTLASRKLSLDGVGTGVGTGAQVIDSAGKAWQPLSLEGGYLELEPQMNLIVVDLEDTPANGFEYLDARRRVGKHVPTRQVTLAVNVIERHA